MQITEPGLFDLSAEDYHADNFLPTPSLSHSILKLIIQRSPRHAKHAHPRLTKQEPREYSSVMEFGSAVHKLLLGKGADIVEITARHDAKHKTKAGEIVTDYKTDAAKEERDEIRAAGKIPMLPCDMPALLQCAKEAEEQIRAHPDLQGFFGPGRSEVVVACKIDGVWCRIMIDRLSDTGQMYDLKSTGLAAAPWSWERRLQQEYATQDAFYRRVLQGVGFQYVPPMIFIPFEQDAPFCLSTLVADSTLQFWAEQEIERGIDTWKDCMASGIWPGYPAVTYHVSATGWMLTQQEARQDGAAYRPQKPVKEKPSATASSFRDAELGEEEF